MNKNISGGLYVVADPAMGLDKVAPVIQQVINGGVDVIQIWNNWLAEQDKHHFVNTLCTLAHKANVPVLINEDWRLLKDTRLDGVHFDEIPRNLNDIRQQVNRPFLCGITCGNDLSKIEWANKNNINYISFCSMFPSLSAGVCEIVTKETVLKARSLTSLPIFLAGGISTHTLPHLAGLGMDGIALISAIMQAADPQAAAAAFKQQLSHLKLQQHEVVINE